MHRADGVFGSLIIRSVSDVQAHLYDIDLPNNVIVINDWLHTPVISKTTSIWFDDGEESADGILINGKGLNVKDPSYFMPLTTFYVRQGLRYRFRLINAGVQLCPMQFSIDDHVLTVIGSEGHPMEPFDVASLIIMQGSF